MPSSSTFIHDFLLTKEARETIKRIAGWDVNESWEVSSRRWRRLEGYSLDSLVTVFHYGRRSVVFINEDLTSFSDKYKSTDFASPSSFSRSMKYELFDDHEGYQTHCKRCTSIRR